MSSPSWNILNNNREWIMFADTKAGALLASNSLLGAAVIHSLPAWTSTGKMKVVLLFSLASASLAFISALFALFCLNPITKNVKPKSVVFFGDIAARYKNDPSRYKASFKRRINSDENLLEDVLDQIWITSKIASSKFSTTKYSIWIFALSLLAAGIAVLIKKL